ncbi:MAG: hypothetical protein U0169_04960 [Polyangiaceae bacterium]
MSPVELRTITCPTCHAPLEVAEGATRVRCRYCGLESQVSAPKPPQAPPPPAAPYVVVSNPGSAKAPLVAGVVVTLLAIVGGGAFLAAKRSHKSVGAALVSNDDLPKTAPTPVWADTKLSFREIDATGSLFASDLQCTLSLEKLPPGTRVRLGTEEGTASPTGFVAIKHSLADKLADVSATEALDYRTRMPVGVPAVLTFANGVGASIPLPNVALSYGIKSALTAARNRPVTFGKSDEAAPAATEHSIAWLGTSEEVLGPAKTLRQVDWVATQENAPARTGKMCPGYKITGKSGTETKDLQQQLQDWEVVVFDRKTTNVVAKKVFEASKDCPMMAFQGVAKSYPNTAEVKGWLRELRSSKTAPAGAATPKGASVAPKGAAVASSAPAKVAPPKR